ELIEYFQPDRTLSRDDVHVVEGVDKGVTEFIFEFERPGVSVVVNALDQADLGAERLCRLDLGDRRAVGQADERLDAAPRGGERHALRMVARRAGDDAALLFLVGKLRYLIICASDLERAGHLQAFRLEI